MKITRIRANNFRQHRSVDVDLTSEQADFVVIKGTMGAGKTNLLNAITWAIYGEVDDLKVKQTELLNDSTFQTMEEGDYGDVEVLVELLLDNGTNAYVSRKQTFKKSSGKASAYGDPLITVQVVRSISTGFEVEPNPIFWIEKNLPARFKPYFLFDGEKLASFFKESDAPRIRSAIQEVARIDTLFKLQEKLQIASVDLSQKAARLTGVDGDRMSEELGRISNAIQAAVERLTLDEENFGKAEAIEHEIDQKLSGVKNLESNIDRKRQIDADIETKKLKLEQAKFDFQARIRALAPGTLLAPALRDLGKKIEEARENKILPPPVEVAYLQGLIDSEQCLCGTNLADDHKAADHIKVLIQNFAQVSEVGNALNEYSSSYLVELSKLTGSLDLIETLNSAISEREEEIRGLYEEQAELSRALEGQDDELVRQLAEARKTARNQAFKYRSAIETGKSEIRQLNDRMKEVESEIRRASETNAEARKARRKAEFARRVSVVAGELYERMNRQVREAVSQSLESQFQEMMWKEGSFASVTIDEDFHVSVLNNRGIESLNRLSAGERLCLAFAFSLTLSKEAGLNFPIVVDTPMGRLAPEVQENLSRVISESTKGIPGATKNHQIILLMTETEYNERVAKVLDTRKPKVLEIFFDPTTAETRVA